MFTDIMALSFTAFVSNEYLWCEDFRNYQEAEIVIADAFRDYNQNRIHSALGYKTPSEFLHEWQTTTTNPN